MISKRLLDIPSPSHPSVFSAASVFTLENIDRRVGGIIEWSKPIYRIKHLPSNKYLTIKKRGTWQCLTRLLNITRGGVITDNNNVEIKQADLGDVDPEDVEIKYSISLERESSLADKIERQVDFF